MKDGLMNGFRRNINQWFTRMTQTLVIAAFVTLATALSRADEIETASPAVSAALNDADVVAAPTDAMPAEATLASVEAGVVAGRRFKHSGRAGRHVFPERGGCPM